MNTSIGTSLLNIQNTNHLQQNLALKRELRKWYEVCPLLTLSSIIKRLNTMLCPDFEANNESQRK